MIQWHEFTSVCAEHKTTTVDSSRFLSWYFKGLLIIATIPSWRLQVWSHLGTVMQDQMLISGKSRRFCTCPLLFCQVDIVVIRQLQTSGPEWDITGASLDAALRVRSSKHRHTVTWSSCRVNSQLLSICYLYKLNESRALNIPDDLHNADNEYTI